MLNSSGLGPRVLFIYAYIIVCLRWGHGENELFEEPTGGGNLAKL